MEHKEFYQCQYCKKKFRKYTVDYKRIKLGTYFKRADLSILGEEYIGKKEEMCFDCYDNLNIDERISKKIRDEIFKKYKEIKTPSKTDRIAYHEEIKKEEKKKLLIVLGKITYKSEEEFSKDDIPPFV